MQLRDERVRELVRGKIDSLGIAGVAVMFGLQVLQIVVAVIPGEPVELLMGFLYGTSGGFALCMAGIAAGTAIVYIITKKLGKKFIEKLNDPEKFKKLSFLRNPAKRDTMLFVLFFIPGTPKDILTYFAPLTKINMLRLIMISCVARIPSVISSNYVGATLSRGKFLHSAIVFAITGVIGIAGILINDKIIEAHRKKNEKTMYK